MPKTNEDEIDLALSLDDSFWRLKLIIADNTIELSLFNLIRENSFDEWHHAKGNSDPDSRMSLFYSFPKKVEYAIQKDVLSGKKAQMINILHAYRNLGYHQAFDRVAEMSASSHWRNDYADTYIDSMDDIRKTLANFHLNLALEVVKNTDSGITMKDEYNTYLEDNEDLRSELPIRFKENLEFRLGRLKDALAFIHMPSESFSTIDIEFENFQSVIDHMIANYGKQAIEKSSFLDNGMKEYYLDLYSESPDYLEPEKIDNDKKIATVEDIKDWEQTTHNLNSDMQNHMALTRWHSVNKKLSLLEEITEWYVWVAC